ncbi:DUF3667 domain-containing protein [Qipengyuania vesicularis]|uniref:DUF3667 domain-containing protein n=1 Tax=Qipengyuania vesicularis TaxID=2867232 RepID=UPI001C86CA3D|nr:DUF3667 domain-containing protein [Qipengyuania vesicularis]
MSDFGEAIGTAVEGGLLAKAVDGDGKGDTPLEKGHFAEGTCLNCGTELIGSHCHNCGQKAHLHRTIGAFMHDLLHGALHFEGRTWKTLPMLFFKPGQLTRRYIEGERARFVSPMALFLFFIFLMFAVFQFAGISAPTDIRGDNGEALAELAATEFERVENRLAEVDAQLADPDLSDEERATLERQQRELADQVAAIRQARENVPFLQGADAAGDGSRPVETDADGDTVIPLTDSDGATMRMKASGIEWIDGGIEKWRTNPGLMLYKLQTNFYKFSWLLIPLSIPFVWLLFAWKRRFKAYDHAIFVTYSLSFMTLLILGLVLAGMAGLHEIFIVFGTLLIPPIHLYKHLRGAYGLSRFSAIWRLVLMLLFIAIVLVLFLQLLLVIGVF